ncbi:MAG: DUF169 domain-containing protein [Deltaproteobacteria bacterium]|nr:DUF169 domain-containing protein [Deltaproteobacteria bacterium]
MEARLCRRLQDTLCLEKKPVVVALSDRSPEGVERFKGEQKACEFIDTVREEDRPFYTTLENQSCRNGNYYLGLAPPFEGLITGEHNAGENGRGLVGSPGAFRRLLSGYEIVPTGTVSVITYAPLDRVPFSDRFGGQVVVVSCLPRQALLLLRGANFRTGHTVPGLTGPSTCSSVIAAPLLRGQVHYSLGCFGLRLFTKIRDEELVVGIPREELVEVVEGLERFLEGRPDLGVQEKQNRETEHG